jgi:DNA-binding MarR family transcriptional regulator
MEATGLSNGTATEQPESDLEAAVQEFFVQLLRTTAALKRLYRCPPAAMVALISSKALGPRHVPVMVRLATEGPMSVGELAERLGVSLPTASLLVGELSRQGLVERREDERDRRRTIVTVAERYREDMVSAYATRSEPVRRAFAALAPDERKTLIKAFRLIGEEYEQAVAEAESGVGHEAAAASAERSAGLR